MSTFEKRNRPDMVRTRVLASLCHDTATGPPRDTVGAAAAGVLTQAWMGGGRCRLTRAWKPWTRSFRCFWT